MKIDYPSEKQIPQLKALWKACFPDTEAFIDGFFETGFSADRCRVMTDGGSAAAALYWLGAEYRGQKLAYVYAVATAPQYRGRGLCRKLMEDAHAVLRSHSYGAALLMPGEPGLRQMYEKFGYRNQCEIEEFFCLHGERIPIKEIEWEEYAALRPGFLPEGGAVQDGLSFLSTYAKFYRGEGFLLACAKEGKKLLGLELLGKKEAAPGILAALECETGTFRTPGTGKATVMSFPLREGVGWPEYFGLTFD